MQETEQSTQRVGSKYKTEGPNTLKIGNDLYELIEIPKNAEGTVDYQPITVQYIYRKIVENTPEDNNKEDQENKDGDNNPPSSHEYDQKEGEEKTVEKVNRAISATPKNVGKNKVQPDSSNATKYPQTNSINNTNLTIIGLMILLMATIILIKKYKKE